MHAWTLLLFIQQDSLFLQISDNRVFAKRLILCLLTFKPMINMLLSLQVAKITRKAIARMQVE